VWDKDTKGMLSAISDKNNRGGLTLLMIAAAFGDTNTVRYSINASEKIEADALISIRGIGKDKAEDKAFYEATKYFVENQQEEGVFIRATSDHGYTALTYAVVAGDYDSVVYIIEKVKEKLGQKEATKLINKKDNSLWTSILYSASFSSHESDSEYSARISILKYLISNGADTKVKGKNFYEGELDLASIASKYAHPEIIKYFRTTYQDLLLRSDYGAIERSFGSNKEIQSSITAAAKIAVKYREINKNDKELYAKYNQVIIQLSAWSKSLAFDEAFSNYRLAAGGNNDDEAYGVYNLKLSYTIDGYGNINDVALSDSQITKDEKNTDKFKFKYVVKYFYKPLTGMNADDLPDYGPTSAQEAYVFIIWSYSKNVPVSERSMFGGPEDGYYSDRDNGISVIYIDGSIATSPRSEVVEPSGHWLTSKEKSGLTKITD
jgi:ankyrin repeat protein